MYNIIPPRLSSHPSMASCKVFFISLAPRLTNKITAQNTRINASSGIHLVKDPALPVKCFATTVESFKAAARPIIKATKEKIPHTRPLLNP